MEKTEIISKILKLVAKAYSHEQSKEVINESTVLLSSRLLDSIVVLRLVTLLEEEFKIEIEAFEVSIENLDTVSKIADFVSKKLHA